MDPPHPAGARRGQRAGRGGLRADELSGRDRGILPRSAGAHRRARISSSAARALRPSRNSRSSAGASVLVPFPARARSGSGGERGGARRGRRRDRRAADRVHAGAAGGDPSRRARAAGEARGRRRRRRRRSAFRTPPSGSPTSCSRWRGRRRRTLIGSRLSRPGRASLDVIGEPGRQPVEQKPAPAARLQIAVHDQPDLERQLEGVRQDRNEFRHAPRDSVLTAADADAGAQRGELGEVAVAAKAEVFAGEQHRPSAPADRNDRLSRSKPMRQWCLQVGERARLAEAREIVAMSIEPDACRTDAAGDEPALGRANHAHRDVGVAARRDPGCGW